MNTLSDLPEMTPQHMCRLFREALRMRPTDYLLHRHLDEARRLLRESELPVAMTARECGFNDASYFSTVFRRYEGISPVGYRKAHKLKGGQADGADNDHKRKDL
ncbi:MAG: helix-turn-helix transcriptional regulator [Ruminococcus sp.]|nr:helix-turn-helix transcriptional regulator [Ruminococcus sp.]